MLFTIAESDAIISFVYMHEDTSQWLYNKYKCPLVQLKPKNDATASTSSDDNAAVSVI